MVSKKLNFLQSFDGRSTSKDFEFVDGEWSLKNSYKAGEFFNGFSFDVNNLKDVFKILEKNVDSPVFIVVGDFNTNDLRGIKRKKRKENDEEPTIKDREINVLPIDIDKWKIKKNEPFTKAIERFVKKRLPKEFHKSDYVYQTSSSFGLIDKSILKCHLFFWLKKPVNNLQIKLWAKTNNELHNDKSLDPAIYTCNQPIYTQRRICIGKKDPIENQLAYIKKKKRSVNWNPETCSIINSKKNKEKIKTMNSNLNTSFDISTATREIVTGENFHENVRSLSLSMLNAGTPVNKVKAHIEGLMYASETQDERWQERFNDIDRAIESAVDIVDNPTFDDFCNWVENEDESIVMKDFSKRILHFDPVTLKMAVNVIDSKIGVGPRAINATIKEAKEEQLKNVQEIARIKESEKRKARGIHEFEVANDNHGELTKTISVILAESNKEPEVFKMGSKLVIVDAGQPKTVRQVIKKDDMGKNYPEMPIVHPIDKPIGVLRARIEKDCVFINEKGIPVICPESILNAIPRMYGIDWRPLSGIIEHPYIDDNWKIIQENGYNKKTGLYSKLHRKLKIDLIEPKKAYKYLIDEVFDEFPFASKLDQAAAIAALMTALQRPYITSSTGFPGFAITSPTQSSGKTTMAQLINYSIYNRPVAVTSWSDSDEELGKHLLAILGEGHSCVLFDNISHGKTIKSDELAKAMTSETYSRRRLGENETEEVPSSVLWMFTGNNISFTGDYATRILPIRIVPNVERPENRKFKRHDIGKWALENRKKIISAVLSIILVGKDLENKVYNKESRFKLWEIFVRKPLLEVSGQDMLEIFKGNNLEDDDYISKKELLEALKFEFGKKTFQTKDIISKMNGDYSVGKSDSDGEALKECIKDCFTDAALNNTKSLGRFLMGLKDNVLGELMLIKANKRMGSVWKVKKIRGVN